MVSYQKKRRQIPGEESESFIGKQDIVLKSLSNELTSLPAPTPMGKIFLVRKYAGLQVKRGVVGSFAITALSKAPIIEVKVQFVKDLGIKLGEKQYRVISHLGKYRLDYGGSYIRVVAPEHLLALLIQYSEAQLVHLFIDES